MNDQHVLTPEVFERIEQELRSFRQSAKARGALLISRSGQLIGQAGDTSRLDVTAAAALLSSSIAASKAIAELIGEREFKGVFLEGEEQHIHIVQVDSEAILAVLFDTQTSLGLVRLRVRNTVDSLAELLASGASASEGAGAVLSPFAEITEEDIDQLFR